jgi:hypothetical protein
MIDPNSTSYPYLAVAQHHGVPYGEVLALADRLASGDRAKPWIAWHFDANAAYERETYRQEQIRRSA